MRALTMDEVEVVGGGVAMMVDDMEEVEVTGSRQKRPSVGYTFFTQFIESQCGLGPQQTADLLSEQLVDYWWAGTYSTLPSLFSTRPWDMTRDDSIAAVKHVADIKAGENHLLFEQASGDLYVIAPNGTLKLVAQGYSGAVGAGINNPIYEDMKNVGPTPRGSYEIGQHDPTKGPITLQLTPIWQVNNREGLLIHGDNNAHNASEGCMILDLTTRTQISQLDHAVVEVVTHVPAAKVYLYNR